MALNFQAFQKKTEIEEKPKEEKVDKQSSPGKIEREIAIKKEKQISGIGPFGEKISAAPKEIRIEEGLPLWQRVANLFLPKSLEYKEEPLILQTIKRQQKAMEKLAPRPPGIPIISPFAKGRVTEFPIIGKPGDVLTRTITGASGLGIKLLAEFPQKVLADLTDLYDIAVTGKRREKKDEPRVKSFTEEAEEVFKKATEKGFGETSSLILATTFGVGSALVDLGLSADISAKTALKITKFDPAVDSALFRLGLDRKFTFEAWERNTKNAARNLGEMGDIKSANQLIQDTITISKALEGEGILQADKITKFVQGVSKKLIEPLGAIPKIRFPLAGEEKALPGFRPKPGQPPAFGLSIEEIEPVGRGGLTRKQVREEVEKLKAEGKSLDEIVRAIDTAAEITDKEIAKGIAGVVFEEDVIKKATQAREERLKREGFIAPVKDFPLTVKDILDMPENELIRFLESSPKNAEEAKRLAAQSIAAQNKILEADKKRLDIAREALKGKEIPKEVVIELKNLAKEFPEKSAEELTERAFGSATQFGESRPALRKFGLREESARISELGVDPEKNITIYRGVSEDISKTIRDGDFVSLNYEEALAFTDSSKNVVSKTVKAKDLITQFSDEFVQDLKSFGLKDAGNELIFSDSKNPIIKVSKSQLTSFFNQVKNLTKPEIVTKLKDGRLIKQREGLDKIIGLDPGDLEGLENILAGRESTSAFLRFAEKRLRGTPLEGRISKTSSERLRRRPGQLRRLAQKILKTVKFDINKGSFLDTPSGLFAADPFFDRVFASLYSSIGKNYSERNFAKDIIKILDTAKYPKPVIKRLNQFINAMPDKIMEQFKGIGFTSSPKVSGAFGVDSENKWKLIMPISPDAIAKPIFKEGAAITHELGGHLIYQYLTKQERLKINEAIGILIRKDPDLLKKIWTSQGITKYTVDNYLSEHLRYGLLVIKNDMNLRGGLASGQVDTLIRKHFGKYIIEKEKEFVFNVNNFMDSDNPRAVLDFATHIYDDLIKIIDENLSISISEKAKSLLKQTAENDNIFFNEFFARYIQNEKNFSPETILGKYHKLVSNLSPRLFVKLGEKAKRAPPAFLKKEEIPEDLEKFRDEIDDIIAGRIKMKPPSSDTKTDWIESIGRGNYARIFGGGRFANRPDEMASELGMTENELLEAVTKRFFQKQQEKLKPEIEKKEGIKFPEKELTKKDIEKLFGSAPELKVSGITPPAKPPKPPKPPKGPETPPAEPEEPRFVFMSEVERAETSKNYVIKLRSDLESLGGLENENIITDLNEIGGYKFKDIGELKEVLKIADKIKKPVSKVTRKKLTPEQREINKLIMRVEREQKTLLKAKERQAIKNLHNIAKPSDATKFYAKEENQSWIRAIKKLQNEKELSSITVAKLKKALKIKNIKRASQLKLQTLKEFMDRLQKGDAFLTPKQIKGLSEILKGIERPDLLPKRIAMIRFGEKTEIMPDGVAGRILNELMPTVDIKEGHPLVTKIVDEADILFSNAEKRIIERNKKFDEILVKAEKSRELQLGEKIKRFISPQNKEIFKFMGGFETDLTKQEMKVVDFLKDFFRLVREDLELEKVRQHYVTHLTQPLMEKIASNGLMDTVIDIFRLKKKENIPIDIMLELDNIIGSEKFFRFALERKGGFSPTTNLRKIVNEYGRLYETKKALDQILPQGQAVVKLLLQPKTAVWTKKFLQNLKGRGLDTNFRTGKMAWLSKLADTVIDVGYIKLLGLNYWSALKNLVAGEANSFIVQDLRKYLLGKQRLGIDPKKAFKLALKYGILEGTFADYARRGIGKIRQLEDLALIGQRGGEYEIRSSLFAAELTEEEWKFGIISPKRVKEIKDLIAITQGIFSKTDSPLWLQTWYGRLVMQMNRWRITNAMLFRRIAKGTADELRQGIKIGKNMRSLLKAFILYGIGMYLSYELGKAGYKRGKRVAQSMAEAINSVIELVTLEPIVNALTDNPTLSVLKEFTFDMQALANYIIIPGIEKPRKIEFKRGIEETFISPIQRPKEFFGLFNKEEDIGAPEIEIESSEIDIPSIVF